MDFEAMAQKMQAHPELESPSFIQGILAGMVTADGQTTETQWIKQLLIEAQAQSVKESFLKGLHQLYYQTLEGLNDSQFRLVLCLPQASAGLDWRAQMLAQFCEGFLYGLGLQGGRLDALQDEPAEALQDFSNIAQMDVAELAEATEQDEADFLELVEYVKVGVLTLHEALNPTSPEPIEMAPSEKDQAWSHPPTETLH